MFNRKLLNVLAYIVAALLVIKALLTITMFIWAYFGTPPIAMFPIATPQHILYMLLIQDLAATVFIYLIVATLRKIITFDHKAMMAEKAKMMFNVPAKTVRRVARKTRRRTTRKK